MVDIRYAPLLLAIPAVLLSLALVLRDPLAEELRRFQTGQLVFGIPALVAGTLIIRFGRSTVRHKRRASASVPAAGGPSFRRYS